MLMESDNCHCGTSRLTYLVSRVIAGHVTFTTVDTHLFVYQSLDLRVQVRGYDQVKFIVSVTSYMLVNVGFTTPCLYSTYCNIQTHIFFMRTHFLNQTATVLNVNLKIRLYFNKYVFFFDKRFGGDKDAWLIARTINYFAL